MIKETYERHLFLQNLLNYNLIFFIQENFHLTPILYLTVNIGANHFKFLEILECCLHQKLFICKNSFYHLSIQSDLVQITFIICVNKIWGTSLFRDSYNM